MLSHRHKGSIKKTFIKPYKSVQEFILNNDRSILVRITISGFGLLFLGLLF